MIDLDIYVMALKANWVKRLVENRDTVHIIILTSIYPGFTLEDYFKYSVNPPFQIPFFYMQVLFAWFNIKKDPKHANDLRKVYGLINK